MTNNDVIGDLNVYTYTLNPASEKVYDCVGKIIKEIAQMFPDSFIHVGGDECPKLYWEKDTACQKLMKQLHMQHINELQSYFINRVAKIVKENGKKPIGRDEVIEGGNLTNDFAVMHWRYLKDVQAASQSGHFIIMTAGVTYLDLQQGEETTEPESFWHVGLHESYGFEPEIEGVNSKL